MESYVIGITGGSGIGKSLLSNSLLNFMGSSQTTILSTDDLHLWPRGHKKWKSITHLNPRANDLVLGAEQLRIIRSGSTIRRRIYNHSTGKHDSPIEIPSKRFIIHEGLHAFYGPELNSLCDLKIFIETTDSLKRHWKILRDTKKRGYTKNQVIQSIKLRAFDNEKYLGIQKKEADIIIFLSESENITNEGSEKEIVEVISKLYFSDNLVLDEISSKIISFLKNEFKLFSDFLSFGNIIGRDSKLVTDSGGNLSFKTVSDKLVVKASGTNMSDISYKEGFSKLGLSSTRKKVLDLVDNKSKISGDAEMYHVFETGTSRASMETGFHVLLDSPVVIHTHPVYVLAVLCFKNSSSKIKSLFPENSTCISFCTPGFSLTKKINSIKDIGDKIFLENHGLIVAGQYFRDCYQETVSINEACKQYLIDNIENFKSFEDFSNSFSDEIIQKKEKFIFPDEVVFKDSIGFTDTKIVGEYIRFLSNNSEQLRYLKNKDVDYIQNMKFEISRGNK